MNIIISKRKVLSFIITLSIICLTFVQTINASVVIDELVELDVEFCGLGTKHTVKLTQQEADDIDTLFDDIQQQLENVETREEAEEIFKEAIEELDKYNLFGSFSIRFLQNLVTGKYQKSSTINKIHSSQIPDGIYNTDCFVLGTSLFLTIITPNNQIEAVMQEIYLKLFQEGKYNLAGLLWCIMNLIAHIKIIHYKCHIDFGISNSYPPYVDRHIPARGAIFTYGSEGSKTFSGKFYGSLGNHQHPCRGVETFSGIRILNNYIGYAKEVGLQREYP